MQGKRFVSNLGTNGGRNYRYPSVYSSTHVSTFIAVPQAQYKWLKDGEPLSDFKDAVVYKIFNAARNDSGSYQCLAQNVAGTIFSEKSEVVVACKLLGRRSKRN